MNWKNIDQRAIDHHPPLRRRHIYPLDHPRSRSPRRPPRWADVNAYASLQDVGIFASVMALGSPWGIVALRWFGIVIGDIVMGSKNFIIGNILIRSLMALFVLAFAAKVDNWKKSFVIAGITEAHHARFCSYRV